MLIVPAPMEVKYELDEILIIEGKPRTLTGSPEEMLYLAAGRKLGLCVERLRILALDVTMGSCPLGTGPNEHGRAVCGKCMCHHEILSRGRFDTFDVAWIIDYAIYHGVAPAMARAMAANRYSTYWDVALRVAARCIAPPKSIAYLPMEWQNLIRFELSSGAPGVIAATTLGAGEQAMTVFHLRALGIKDHAKKHRDGGHYRTETEAKLFRAIGRTKVISIN